MANYDLNVIFKRNSGLPEDSCVNTLHFEVNAPDTLAGLCTGVHAAYNTWCDQYMNSNYSSVDYKVYEAGPNPGGPAYTISSGISVGAGTQATEVALCLSYATVDNPDASLPRRRGRIYLGPLAALNAERPDQAMRTATLALGSALASVGTASNTTWLMKSATDNSYHKIESIWVDDSWDTQRRRGLGPTLRNTADVQ